MSSKSSKREALLQEAHHLFYERGIRAVGVDTISASSGVAKMTLYSHFDSKDDLIAACLESVDEKYRGWLERKVQDRADQPAEQILAIFDALEGWFENPRFRGCAFVNAAIELPDVDHPAWGAVHNHKRRMRAWIAELAAEAGVAEPKQLAEQILLLMEGAIITAVVERYPNAAQNAKDIANHLLVAAGALPAAPETEAVAPLSD